MLSKISLVLNAILLILIINLYVRECNESDEVEGQEQVIQEDSANTSLRIAYINTDTLDAKYLYSLEIVETLKGEMDKLQRRLERKATKSQQEFDLLQQQSRTMTPAQLQQAQQRAMQLEQEIQLMQQDMATEFADTQNDLQLKLISKLDTFLTKYNKNAAYDFIIKKHNGSELLIANKGHDITNEVLELLNNEFLGTDSKKDSLK